MGEDQERSSGTGGGRSVATAGFREAWRGRARWQQAAAVVSLVLTLVSGVLIVTTGAADGPTSTSATSPSSVDDDPSAGLQPRDGVPDAGMPGISSGLWEGPLPPPLPGEPGADEPAGGDPGPADGDDPLEEGAADEGDPGSMWSPALFKTGFSFFMGFSLAFAIRSFVRISLVAIGMMGLMLFGLEYMGLVTVEWGVMADRWDGLLGWLRPQLTSFQGFVTGQLPSAAAATGGLVTGWRRG